MNYLDQAVNTIKTIQLQKEKDMIEPCHVLLKEILRAITDTPAEETRKALRTLCLSKKIVFGPTINDTWFRVKSEK